MATSWRQAPVVAEGDPITSQQHNALARAWNDRIKSGIGDSAWRIMWYAHSLFRKVRNDDGGNLTPEDEWWKIYAMIASQSTNEWPVAGAGDPGGVNLSSPVMAFVFGDAAGIVGREDQRVNIELPYAAADTEEIWRIGKTQRGYIDPVTGIIDSPAWRAARDHLKIGPDHVGKFQVTYGSFQPTPPLSAANCGDSIPTPKWDIKFTATAAGLLAGKSDITYTGFCPTGSTGAGDANAAIGIVLGIEDYYILRHDNTVDVLSYNHYLLGPFSTAGVLQHGTHGGLQQCLNRYVLDYRGTPAQRAGAGYDVRSVGFPFENFFTRQYLLAPQDITTPIFRFPTAVSADEPSLHSPYAMNTGYTFTGFRVKVTNYTSGNVNVRVLFNGVEIMRTGAITSNGSTIYILSGAHADGTLQFRSAEVWNADVEIDALVLYTYKPGINDAYVVIRQSDASSALIFQYDGDGTQEEDAKSFYSNYTKYGMVANTGSAGLPAPYWPSDNGIYEAARKLVHTYCRMIEPDDLIGYACNADGESELYFNRYAFGSGNDNPLDHFEGMMDLQDDATATANGYSNEWVCFLSFAHYHQTTAAWLRTAHESIHGMLIDPAHEYSGDIIGDAELAFHMCANDGANVIHSEAPPGYRYVKATNGNFTGSPAWTAAEKTEHFKSIQVYQAPYLVKSIQTTANGIRVRLGSRLHHNTASAPTLPINVDYTTWNKTDLNNQEYATDENRVMKWIVHVNDGDHYALIEGDAASDGLRDLQGVTVNSAIIPRVYFVKLIPEVYEDDNRVPNTTDTRFEVDPYVQMDFYSRPIVEGFVDGFTSTTDEDNDCTANGGMYDFSFENAVNQATGGRWLYVLPLDKRADGPLGFGPLPNTIGYADIFNQFAKLINLLTRARLDLPVTLESNLVDEDTFTAISYDQGVDLPAYVPIVAPPELGTYGTDVGGSGKWAMWVGLAPVGTFNAPAGWVNWPHASTRTADKFSDISNTKAWGLVDGEPWRYAARHTENTYQFRIPSSQAAYNAIPSEITGLLENDNLGLFGNFSKLTEYSHFDFSGTFGTCGGIPWPGDAPNVKMKDFTESTENCGLITGSPFVAHDLVATAHAIQVEASGATVCTYGGAQSAIIFSLGSSKIGSGNLFISVPTTTQTI